MLLMSTNIYALKPVNHSERPTDYHHASLLGYSAVPSLGRLMFQR
jgi:hypothetical protein